MQAVTQGLQTRSSTLLVCQKLDLKVYTGQYEITTASLPNKLLITHYQYENRIVMKCFYPLIAIKIKMLFYVNVHWRWPPQ